MASNSTDVGFDISLKTSPEFTLSLIAAIIFAVGAGLVFLNLTVNCCLKCARRTPAGVPILFLTLLFALVRVATYVLLALVLKRGKLDYVKAQTYLEDIGLFLILFIITAMWELTARAKAVGKVSRLPRAATIIQTLLTILLCAGFACWIANKVLGFDGFDSGDASKLDTSAKLQKAGAVIYGVVIAIYLFLTLYLFSLRGARAAAFGLLLMGIFMGAKVYFIIWYIFSPNGASRAHDNELYWPLVVLTEILTLALLAFPCFVRRAVQPSAAPLPVTDANPNEPVYLRDQYAPTQQYAAPPAQFYEPTPAGGYSNGPAVKV